MTTRTSGRIGPTFRPPAPQPDRLAQIAEQQLGLDLETWEHRRFHIEGLEILSIVVRITPLMALDWLTEHNHPITEASYGTTEPVNRKLSSTVAGGYGRQIADRRWKVSHQNIIAFDPDGMLLDGQHRLTGLAETPDNDGSLGLWFRVEIGWPRDTFAVVDNGLRRSAHQLLPRRHAMETVAAVRIVAAVSGQASPSELHRGDRFRAAVDTATLLGWLEEWPDMSEHSQSVAQVYSTTHITKSAHLALLTMAATTPAADKIPAWVEGLLTGADLADGDPRRHLRNRWARDSKALAASTRDRWGLLVRAWNAYAQGRSIGVLKLPRNDEDIPPVWGFDYTRFARN